MYDIVCFYSFVKGFIGYFKLIESNGICNFIAVSVHRISLFIIQFLITMFRSFLTDKFKNDRKVYYCFSPLNDHLSLSSGHHIRHLSPHR